ncbi:hypothetical protein OIU85_004513 [Salix viminalis]|uniref:Uncharacterized protein n=1 Tax=Salix viminalis TaxID=40686 RepID=A0A9Q0PSP3_SALVM|nr:hypothetical protein OIU85_004513 [Salix viminalis]
MGLNLGGLWQQGHSATYNTRRVFKSMRKGFYPLLGGNCTSKADPARVWPAARVPPGPKRPPTAESAIGRAGRSVASSPGFDLEAFDHNPTPRVKLTLSHDGLNPAHVPYWWVNNPTLGELRFTMIGRADIEGSKKQRRYERLGCHKPVIHVGSTLASRVKRGGAQPRFAE